MTSFSYSLHIPLLSISSFLLPMVQSVHTHSPYYYPFPFAVFLISGWSLWLRAVDIHPGIGWPRNRRCISGSSVSLRAHEQVRSWRWQQLKITHVGAYPAETALQVRFHDGADTSPRVLLPRSSQTSKPRKLVSCEPFLYTHEQDAQDTVQIQ